jgi:hypothetical protein
MAMTTEQERRIALKARRTELEAEAADLRAKQARLEGSQDHAALRAHAERLSAIERT